MEIAVLIAFEIVLPSCSILSKSALQIMNQSAFRFVYFVRFQSYTILPGTMKVPLLGEQVFLIFLQVILACTVVVVVFTFSYLWSGCL